MKYAIISDVHANPRALATALADAEAQGCINMVMLGDITGYGYDLRASLRMVRNHFNVVLMGNHDSACLGKEPEWCLQSVRNYAVDLQQGIKMSDDERHWLAARKYTHKADGAFFTHANFIAPETWAYILTPSDAVDNFQACEERLLFCGHTHRAVAYEMNDLGLVVEKVTFKKPPNRPESVVLTPRKGSRYLVNVGSVGHPRNDHCSVYVTWDTETDEIVFRRLPFDFDKYVDSMTENDITLPHWLKDLCKL